MLFGLIVAAVMILVGIALIALALLLGWYVRRGERQQPPEPIRPTGAQIRLRADKLHDQGRAVSWRSLALSEMAWRGALVRGPLRGRPPDAPCRQPTTPVCRFCRVAAQQQDIPPS